MTEPLSMGEMHAEFAISVVDPINFPNMVLDPKIGAFKLHVWRSLKQRKNRFYHEEIPLIQHQDGTLKAEDSMKITF